MDDATQSTQRPLIVTIATICLAVQYAGGLVTWIFTAHWSNPLIPVVYAFVCLLVFFVLHSIYIGRNWVRWLVIIFGVIGLLSLPSYWAHFTLTIERVRFIIQTVLQVVAIVLLLLPSSARWFSRNRPTV
jgi:hypothetical protein